MEIAAALRVLGLTHRASLLEAKSAYRRLAKKWHPDRVQGTPEEVREAEERMKTLNQAYRCVTKYLDERTSPPEPEKPWWWGEEAPPPASWGKIRRPVWFRGFTFGDPSRYRDDVWDYLGAAGLVSLGIFLIVVSMPSGNTEISLVGAFGYFWMAYHGLRG